MTVAARPNTFDASPRRYARVGGVIYLAIIVLGLFGEVVVRGSLIAPDAETTLRNIASAEGLWRLGIAGDLLMHVLDVPLIVVLYCLLRPVSRWLALLATLLNIVQTSVLVANKLTLVVPLVVLSAVRPDGSAGGDAGLRAVGRLAISLHGYGFGVGLIFFGLACLVRGFLMVRSGYFPKVLGVLLGLAGVSYIVNSAALLLAPSLASALFPAILLPALVGELATCLWLIVKGVRIGAWESRLAGHGPVADRR